MGLKSTKRHKRLMRTYKVFDFGSHDTYQVLVDAEMILQLSRCKIELEPALKRTLRGPVKPMITKCDKRMLRARQNEPGFREAYQAAKTCETRRCGHWPESDYPEPLSTVDCLRSIFFPGGKGNNKHHYVVASQIPEVREMLKTVPGVPLVFLEDSVMKMERMSQVSVRERARIEQSKLRAEIKPGPGKRKREEDKDVSQRDEDEQPKSKKNRGPKGPNPLSVKKSKSKKPTDAPSTEPTARVEAPAEAPAESPAKAAPKRKRRRKNKSTAEAAEGGGEGSDGAGEAQGDSS